MARIWDSHKIDSEAVQYRKAAMILIAVFICWIIILAIDDVYLPAAWHNMSRTTQTIMIMTGKLAAFILSRWMIVIFLAMVAATVMRYRVPAKNVVSMTAMLCLPEIIYELLIGRHVY